MEEFSQSRGADDLFDDEIIPIEHPTPITTEHVTTTLDRTSLDPSAPTLQSQPTRPQERTSPSPSTRGRGRGRGGPPVLRGAIRGGAPRQQATYAARGAHALSDSKWSTRPTTQQPPPTTEEKSQDLVETVSQAENTEPPVTTDVPPPDAPTGPAARARPPAVRGDRSSTGGFAKPKLTEEELTAKLAAAKQKSMDLAAAHARAQADADQFAERERVAGARRRREEGERKKMEGEREKNRARKLGAREGREWDKDKEELAGGRGYAPRPRPDDEEQQDLSIYEWHEDRWNGRARGGRARGRGRGGRGGRGGFEVTGGRPSPQQEPNVNAREEFPALPGAADAKESNSEAVKQDKPRPPPRVDSDKVGPGKSWADQMET